MFQVFARLILGRVLADPTVKARIFDELRRAASRTETELDDSAVKVVSEVWDIVVPIVVGRA